MIDVRVLKDSQYPSLKLHFLKQSLQEAPAVHRGEVVTGTDANKVYLEELGYSHAKLEAAAANDLIVVVETTDETAADRLLAEAEDRLEDHLLREMPKQNRRPYGLSQSEGKSPFFMRQFSDERSMGNIHSVFKTSFNVLFDEQLYNFSTTGMPVSPHGCVLAKEKMDRIINVAQPGDLVKLEKKTFTFYMKGDLFAINVSELKELDLKIPQFSISPQAILASKSFWHLSRLPFEEEMGLKNEGTVRESFLTLRQVDAKEPEAIQQAVNFLIGRGGGLTPSGDDVMLGFGMVRKAFRAEDRFSDYVKKGLKSRNTTAVSMAYYEGLLEGYINSLFLAFLTKLAYEMDDSSTQQFIDLITQYGHTSGYDTLYGCYLGLQSLSEA